MKMYVIKTEYLEQTQYSMQGEMPELDMIPYAVGVRAVDLEPTFVADVLIGRREPGVILEAAYNAAGTGAGE